MQIIKLNATRSTNLYLKNLSVEKQLADFTTVVAEHQVQGRGQMGTSWYSEEGKNLTFSVFKKIEGLIASRQFTIGMCTSLAVYSCLHHYQVPDLAVKWPNDIMSGPKKICGILIENTLSGRVIQSSILGIGLNVNQTNFSEIMNASSLKLICAQNFDLDELLARILDELQRQFDGLRQNGYGNLKKAYEKTLFRKDKPSTFSRPDNTTFSGFIRGISDTGMLKVEIEGRRIREYDLKEVSLLLN